MTVQDIDRNIYESRVITSGWPVLLCFFKNTVFHAETAALVEQVSRQFEAVRFYAVREEELEFFFEKFHCWGTPIFIFLAGGNEQGRLLGTVTAERLKAFLVKNICELKH